jgi:hypothetical protein
LKSSNSLHILLDAKDPEETNINYLEDNLELLLEEVIGCDCTISISHHLKKEFLEDYTKESVPLNSFAKTRKEIEDRKAWQTSFNELNERVYSYGEFVGNRRDLLKSIYDFNPDLEKLLKTAVKPVKLGKSGDKKEKVQHYICVLDDEKLTVKVLDSPKESILFCLKSEHATEIVKLVSSGSTRLTLHEKIRQIIYLVQEREL